MDKHLAAVDVDGRFVVNAAEIEHYSLAVPVLGDVDAAVIPHCVDKVLMVDTRQRAFGAEGNSDVRSKSGRVEQRAFNAAF